MAMEFDIIKYICGLTDYTISESVATNIALRRGVSEVTEYKELTQKDNDLLLADVLVSLRFRPKKTASWSKSSGSNSSENYAGTTTTTSKSHGGFSISETSGSTGGSGSSTGTSQSESRGSEEMGDISDLLEYAYSLYEKWNEPIPNFLKKYSGNLEWNNDF